MKDHQAFLKEAIQLAKNHMNANKGGPFGAVVVKNGQIIGKGGNEVVAAKDPTAHAEIMAIRNAGQYLQDFNLSGCSLYTSCEPCPMCLGAVYWARLDCVYFAAYHQDAAQSGFDDQFIYEEMDKPLNQRDIPFYQALREEGVQVFRDWDNKPDKVMY